MFLSILELFSNDLVSLIVDYVLSLWVFLVNEPDLSTAYSPRSSIICYFLISVWSLKLSFLFILFPSLSLEGVANFLTVIANSFPNSSNSFTIFWLDDICLYVYFKIIVISSTFSSIEINGLCKRRRTLSTNKEVTCSF